MSDLKKHRIENGLCPRCGSEAAPWYLCPKCRELDSIGRILRRGERNGDVFRGKRDAEDGRRKIWGVGTGKAADMSSRPSPLFGQGKAEADKRLRPRIGGIPVGVESELIEIAKEFDRPFTIEEIQAAWGRLRVRRGRTSAARDMAHIIAAQRKREARAERRRARRERR